MFIRPKQWPWIAFGVVFAAAAVTLPFALWHPNAFMRNVIWLQTREPFRVDSLSYLAWAAQHGMGRGSFVWAIGAGSVAGNHHGRRYAEHTRRVRRVHFLHNVRVFCVWIEGVL